MTHRGRIAAVIFVLASVLPGYAQVKSGSDPEYGATQGVESPRIQGLTPETLYADAVAKEAAVRTALTSSDVMPTVLNAVRTVMTQYEALVQRHPSSAYCDDALWRAGRLALDAFAQFGEPRDRTAGVRLLRRLASQYPSSRFARQVPGLVAASASKPVTAVAEAPPPSRVATIKSIRRVVLPDAVRIVVELDSEVATFHDERLANPLRVFVDLASTRAAPDLVDRTIRFEGDADVVRQVRIGRHPNYTTRVVLDAANISSYSVYPLYSPYRLVIDCIRETTNTVVASVQPPPVTPTLPARRSIPIVAQALPMVRPALPPDAAASELPLIPMPLRGRRTAPMYADALPNVAPSLPPGPSAPEPPVAAPLPSVSSLPAERNIAGGFSIARQLGLSVSRIVIDPGHGGQDPGAVGKGLTEASLVLDIALRVEKLLAKVPGVEVILTRRTDEYVPLQERTAIANHEGADLFLSIHANASNNTKASGIETYFLNFATNASAAAIAARENAASGQAMGALPDFVKMIALNNKLDESRELATYVQRAMIERVAPPNKNVKDLGVKQAPFVVLIGAAMPSVLAEISFVTNAQEAKLLRGTAYRQRIAEALFNAIRRYQSSLTTAAKVAAQQ
jgi:N-acetylmuramoyl-L-alanine amidase